MQGEDLNIYIDVVEDLKKLLMVGFYKWLQPTLPHNFCNLSTTLPNN